MARVKLLPLIVVLLLAALCAQVLASAWTTSPTFDEPYHIVRSYVYLETGDSALLAQGGHPPFANMLSVFPLLLRSDIVMPPHQPGWPDVTHFSDLFRVADEFFWRIGNDAEGMIHWARLPVMLLSVSLAALVFLWARELNGMWAGLLALLLYVFDPNILAHSSVVTTDLGGVLFAFASVYCLWRFCQRPSWGGLVLTGVLFGLAQATKFSALFLAPVFGILLLVWVFVAPELAGRFAWISRRSPGPGSRLRRVGQAFALCAAIFLVGFVVLWGVYGFEVGTLLLHQDSHSVLDRFIPWDHPGIRRAVYAVAENTPLPAPAYFAELTWLRDYARRGHSSFLMGEYGRTGWWFYFPVAFLIKTPIPTLILLAVAVLQSVKRRADLNELFLLVPMLLFFVAGMASSIDIGYRNILLVLPLAYVYVSRAATKAVARWMQAGLALLCIWCIVSTMAIAPHYLAYFNESVGGADNGYKYLVDSNLDWGQDLKNLKRYVDARGIRTVYLSYFGTADPSYYGIDFAEMPERSPASDDPKAYYAISATSLQNVYAQGDRSGHWLAQYEPLDKVGYSIFVYRLP